MSGGRGTSSKKHKSRRYLNSRLSSVYGPKHIDQIQASLCKEARLEYNEDVIGGGLFYCVECDKFFENSKVLSLHKKTKRHKRRLKTLKDTVHDVKDAEEAAGLITKRGT